MSELESSGGKRSRGAACKARNKLGKQCKAIAGADGFCTAHSGRTDMRRLGSKGGRTGRGNAERRRAVERTPELRAVLRTLDPHVVKAGLEEILAGGNAGAKVSAVKLLADLELYKGESEEEWRRRRDLEMSTAAEEFDRKIAERVERLRTIEAGRRAAILEPLGLAELADKDDDEVVAELARRLAAIPEHVRSEFAP